jgi:tetratricopeptide (TPR) repeat protein
MLFSRILYAQVILLVLVCSEMALSQVHSISEPIEIRGQVRFSKGGAPVDNVIVRLEALSGGAVAEERTDRLGKFRFSGLSPKQYFLFIHLQDFQEVRREVNLIMQASDYVQIMLVPEKSEVTTARTEKVIDANAPLEAVKEFDRGQVALAERRFDAGIRHFENAISLYPKFVQAQLRLGTAYMDVKNWEKAEQVLQAALQTAPNTVNAFFALGEIYLQEKRLEEAEKILRRGLRLEVRAWRAHFTLGRVYLALNNTQAAAKQIAISLQLNPNFPDAHLLAGNILLGAGKREDAETEFQEYLRLAPKGEYADQARQAVAKLKSDKRKL